MAVNIQPETAEAVSSELKALSASLLALSWRIDEALSTVSVDTTSSSSSKEKIRVKSKDKSKELPLEPVECKSISRISFFTEKSVQKEILTPQSTFDDTFEIKAARYFFDLAKRDHPRLVRYEFEEVMNRWVADIVKLLTKYEHSQDDVRLVFRYVREVDEFWSGNILSVAKLLKLDRDHIRYFDKMLDLAHKMEPKEVPALSGMTIVKGAAAVKLAGKLRDLAAKAK